MEFNSAFKGLIAAQKGCFLTIHRRQTELPPKRCEKTLLCSSRACHICDHYGFKYL